MTTEIREEDDPQMAAARARLGTALRDKWRLDALLGVGGMAAVYAATHLNGKRAAVKVLHAEFSHDEAVRDRFKQEGYAANAIQHDGAVSVLDDDVGADGSAFIVMELLDGETVAQRWRRRGRVLPVDEVLAIADSLLDVLAAAHAKDVVHRDIKPDNLFLTKSGALKVLDFGIAKVFERHEGTRSATRAGTVMGTPGFMAPEQTRERWDEVDGRTDLWGVGATMFMLLAGRRVHVAKTGAEENILIATTPAPPLVTVAAGVPPEVAAIVDRALAVERTARFTDARSMQQAVRRARQAVAAAAVPRTAVGAQAAAPPRSVSGQHAAAPPSAAAGASPGAAAWTMERDTRLAEATRLRAAVAAVQQRYAAARKHTVDTQASLETARAERGSLGRWLDRQVGTRSAAVEEARKEVQQRSVAIARRAIADRAHFGDEFDPAREEIARLDHAAAATAHDVEVHVASLHAYDRTSLRVGVVMMGAAAVLGLALLLTPIVWLATRVQEPVQPATAQPK